jgi:hypothetical protein
MGKITTEQVGEMGGVWQSKLINCICFRVSRCCDTDWGSFPLGNEICSPPFHPSREETVREKVKEGPLFAFRIYSSSIRQAVQQTGRIKWETLHYIVPLSDYFRCG